jgi:hypothetical protein
LSKAHLPYLSFEPDKATFIEIWPKNLAGDPTFQATVVAATDRSRHALRHLSRFVAGKT